MLWLPVAPWDAVNDDDTLAVWEGLGDDDTDCDDVAVGVKPVVTLCEGLDEPERV